MTEQTRNRNVSAFNTSHLCNQLMQKHDAVTSKSDSFQEDKMQINLLVVSQQDAAPAWFTITPEAYTLT